MIVKFKKLVPEAVIPFKATDNSAAFDLVATSVRYDDITDCWIYGLGFATEFDPEWVAHVYPRSSNRKTDYYLPNSVGIIDSDYRGEWLVCLKNRDFNTSKNPPYKLGDRIAQVLFEQVHRTFFMEVESLNDSERGAGGFGSTGGN